MTQTANTPEHDLVGTAWRADRLRRLLCGATANKLRTIHRRIRPLGLVLLACMLVVNGCSTTQRALNQFYAEPLTTPVNIQVLEATYTNWVAVAERIRSSPDQQAARNAAIGDLLRLSDYKYEKFKTKLYVADAGYNSLIDLTSIGLSAAATLVGGGAGQALSATDTGLKAAQGKLAERWLSTKTMRVLLIAMDAQRAQLRKSLYDGMKQPYDRFSAEESFELISRYHACASIPNALAYIEATMGEKKETAEAAATR